MGSSKSRKEIWNEWQDLVNMPPQELEDWLDTRESKSVGDSDTGESTGHASGRQIVEIKRTSKDGLTSAPMGPHGQSCRIHKTPSCTGWPENRQGKQRLALFADELGT